MSSEYRLRRSRLGRNSRLWATASSVALAVSVLSGQLAAAATYNVSDEASLDAALAQIDTVSDTSAVIVLLQNIAIANPAAVPPVSEPITLNTGGFTLTNGEFTGGQALTISNGGQVSVAGNATLGGLTLSSSNLRIAGGATVSAGGLSTGLQGTSTLTIDGAGSALTTPAIEIASTSGAGLATVTVQNGGLLHANSTTTNSNIGDATNVQASLLVTDAGSRLQIDASLDIGANTTTAAGSLTVANGASASVASELEIGTLAPAAAIPASFEATGAGTSVSAPLRIDVFKGSMSVLDGAQVTTARLGLGAGGTGTLLVSGAGSKVTASGAVIVGSGPVNGTGVVTLANGGVLDAAGTFTLANIAAVSGVLNIGGAVGQAATGAGVLDTATVAFGPGAGQINFNHTATDYVFDAAIASSGSAGAINQVSGVTHLTGASSGFTGVAIVSGGALLVDNVLGDAASSVVVNGGQLGGAGEIGGNVTVNGGMLAPAATGPSTLTIDGNLTLGSGAVLQMQLGQAGVAGGSLNDLIKVGGNLTLGGTLNVTQSALGAFGDGIYTLIDYNGTLTDNGLNIGSLPVGSGTIQTSIAHQVNLVVANAPTFSFWDGAGAAGDGQITGGSGTWQATGDLRWTNAAGTANGAFANGSFVVFAGTGGTVTVNNAQGQVEASGIQFASDGYVVTNSTVTLTGAQADVRVGDGTANGANFTAIIASSLNGSAELVKTDLGTLVLQNVINNYTGGTAMDGGVLQVAGDRSLGALSGGLSFDGGTLQTTHTFTSARTVSMDGDGVLSPNAGTTLTLTGLVSGAGVLTQGGSGTVMLANDETYTGGTVISAGTLQIGNGGTTGSIVGDVVDNATLAFDRSDITTFGGAISGTGVLNQIGGGTLILTGDNTFTGATTIASGTLQIGDGGTSGKLVGDTVDNGVLVFDRSDRLTYGGTITGSGSFNQLGTGATILTGDSNYTGGTTITAGTLQLGLGGTTGSIVGDVTDNGTLAFDRSDVATFGGVISGSGGIAQLGTGTTVLTAANTFTGGTVVSAGTLQVGAGGTTGSIVGDVANNGTLAFDRSDAVTFDGAISGSGMVSQIGTGTTTLAGVNTYTGGTLISSGTLIGSATSFGTGPIVDNASLVIDQPADPTFANAISGAGTLTKTGDGTLILTGVNTYMGGTTISGGTLVGSATSFGMGTIVDNAALVIDQPTAASFQAPIDGTGSFTKTGAGELVYAGTGTLTGPTTVAAGLLTVNGSLGGSAVQVLSGATLGGSGTVGSTNVQSGATVAPGATMPTLHVNGAFSQAAGSTYQVVLNPNSSASSLIAVSGTATLAPGAILNVTKSTAGDYQAGTVYTVLSAAGALDGTYALAGDKAVSAFLALNATTDANHAFLAVVQTGDPSSAATTPNQSAAAGGLPASGAVTTGVLNSSSDASASQLLAELAADGYAGAKGALVSDSRLVRDMAIDRLQSVLCAAGSEPGKLREGSAVDGGCAEDANRPASWGQVIGAWGHTDGNGNAGDVSRSTGGFLLGFDAPVARQWRLGGFLGYSQTNLTMDARTASSYIDNYHVGAYGGGQVGPLGLRFGAAYTDHDITTDRTVALPSVTDQLEANYTAHTLQGFAEAGWRMQAGRLGLEPFANVAYVTLHTASFSETGGVAALSGAASDTDSTFTTLGVRPSFALALGPVRATVHGTLGWRHDFGQTTPTSTVRFVEGGDPFTVEGAPVARDEGVAEMALDLKTSDITVFSLSYGAQGWGGDFDQTVRVNLHLSF